MKWLVGWIIVFVISWGLGALICGLTAWSKNYKTTKVAAIIFFGLPVLFLVVDLAKQSLTQNNYEAAVEEVKQLCAKDGGDKIYKTVDNVQGVLQMRARNPDRFLHIQDQYGDFEPYINAIQDYDDVGMILGWSYIPELAFSRNSAEKQKSHEVPRGKQGYWFIEQKPMLGSHIEIYRRSYLIYKNETQDNFEYQEKQKNITKILSRYGYLTEDLTTKEMRDKWIGAGRIKIIDLQTNEVLAERKGYVLAEGNTAQTDHWQFYGVPQSEFICPNTSLLQFLQTTLKPVQSYPTNEQLESIAKD